MDEILRRLALKAVWSAIIDEFAPKWMPQLADHHSHTSCTLPVRNMKDGRQFYIHITVNDKEKPEV